MAQLPPLSSNNPTGPHPSNKDSTKTDSSKEKVSGIFDRFLKNIFTSSSDKAKMALNSSENASPKFRPPSQATSYEEYEKCLDNLILNPVTRDISQEELLQEGMGTETFENLIDQIIIDLNRKDNIILNGLPLELKSGKDNIKEIKNRIITSSNDGRIVGLLHQGIHVSLTITPAHEQLSNFNINIVPLDMDENKQKLLDEDSLRKIELEVRGDKVILKVSSPITLVKSDEDGNREDLHYISVKGHYEDGRITTTFSKIDLFEEISHEDVN